MGLDVFLYKYENKSETDRLEKEYEVISEKNWNDAGGYETMSQEKKDEVRRKNKELAIEMELGEYGEDDKNKVKIECDSAIDKDHYFKVGYFRSSYNGGGINNILRNLSVPDLNDIFDAGDEYCFQPKWKLALNKCNESIRLLENAGNYRCFSVSHNILGQPKCESEKDALNVFAAELSKNHDCNYGNINGEFNLSEPLKVFGLIPGTKSWLKKQQCTYVITEGQNSWYITALKIVKETIEYVLSQPDIEKYFLHWSS
jgi:hypothetical protein